MYVFPLPLSARVPLPCAGADADLVAAVGWTQTNVLFSVADDKCIQSWSIDGEPLAKVCDIDCFATDFHWLVAPGAADSEVLALASGDGAFLLSSFSSRSSCVAW